MEYIHALIRSNYIRDRLGCRCRQKSRCLWQGLRIGGRQIEGNLSNKWLSLAFTLLSTSSLSKARAGMYRKFVFRPIDISQATHNWLEVSVCEKDILKWHRQTDGEIDGSHLSTPVTTAHQWLTMDGRTDGKLFVRRDSAAGNLNFPSYGLGSGKLDPIERVRQGVVEINRVMPLRLK